MGVSAFIRPVALICIGVSSSACQRPTDPLREEPPPAEAGPYPTETLRAERIPKGAGWYCWTGRCDRVCRGLPGPPDNRGVSPEPACAEPKTAFCMTYDLGAKVALGRKPHWECFDTRISCEANQRRYVAEARAGRDYSAVSPCTELP